MPKGETVKKGMRFGGRQKGTPNRKTVAALRAQRIAEQAQAEVDKAKAAKVKLGKDVLEDYMGAFHNLSVFYQRRIAEQLAKNLEPDPKDIAAFEKWGGLTATTAKNLAEFQSPKFKAIAVLAPPPSPVPPANGAPGKVIDLTDAVALSRNYQNLMKRVV